MNAMHVRRSGPHVTIERTIDGDGIRADRVESWNLCDREWQVLVEFVALELRAARLSR